MSEKKSPIIVALDIDGIDEANKVLDNLAGMPITVKVGMKLYTAYGPKLIESIQKRGLDIFLDLKYHDIPNTVREATKEAARLGVNMLTIHASGGKNMIEAAKDGVSIVKNPPSILAVTVLTSMDKEDLNSVGVTKDLGSQVLDLAQLAVNSGADGIVCSPQEVKLLKTNIKQNFFAVTPGIRPAWSVANDQKRITTPMDAIKNGSDYLVIGRPIYKAENPKESTMKIFEEINFRF